MFWTFERPIPCVIQEREVLAYWMIVIAEERRIDDGMAQMSVIVHTAPAALDNAPSGRALTAIKRDATFPDDVHADHFDVVRLALAGVAFINSPYMDVVKPSLPRPVRRAIQREGGEIPSPAVNVVTLRRPMPEQGKSLRESDGEGREYSHRWWVSGHIRAQWYPSIKAQKLIWIAPYIKGPESAPVKERVYAVVR